MFRKRRRDDQLSDSAETGLAPDPTDQDASAADAPDSGAGSDADGPPPVAAARAQVGPRDVSEAPDDGVERIDFGGLKVPGVSGMEVSLEVDQASGQIIAATVVLGGGALQLQPVAAPRSGGFWPEVLTELRNNISASGGVVDEVAGLYGPELACQVPAVDPNGAKGLQPARFVGIEGPRWLLRAVFLGAATTDPKLTEVMEDVMRGCVLDRGGQPMAPGEPLPMRLPEGAEAGAGEPAEPPAGDSPQLADLNPFERGPEITEIH